MPTSSSYHSYLVESLKDPQEAAAYLEVILEDGSFEEVRLALRDVVEAQISASDDSQAVLHLKETYKTLSQESHLEFSTLLTVIGELGFKFTISPKQDAA
jgi:DNA-binding phage protein